jgi:hypothetical protein
MSHLDTAHQLGSARAEVDFEKQALGGLARTGIGAGIGAAGGAAMADEGNRLLGGLQGGAAGAAAGAAAPALGQGLQALKAKLRGSSGRAAPYPGMGAGQRTAGGGEIFKFDTPVSA